MGNASVGSVITDMALGSNARERTQDRSVLCPFVTSHEGALQVTNVRDATEIRLLYGPPEGRRMSRRRSREPVLEINPLGLGIGHTDPSFLAEHGHFFKTMSPGALRLARCALWVAAIVVGRPASASEESQYDIVSEIRAVHTELPVLLLSSSKPRDDERELVFSFGLHLAGPRDTEAIAAFVDRAEHRFAHLLDATNRVAADLQLSTRETEYVFRMANGMPSSLVKNAMAISRSTRDSMRARIQMKTGLPDPQAVVSLILRKAQG